MSCGTWLMAFTADENPIDTDWKCMLKMSWIQNIHKEPRKLSNKINNIPSRLSKDFSTDIFLNFPVSKILIV